MPIRSRNLAFLIALLILLAGALPACAAASGNPLALMPVDRLPADVRSAPASVVEAYQFAAANSKVMKAIPCYCGCGTMGHTSNYSCYVSGLTPDGGLEFDSHALGCSICVDITQDAMRLLGKGRSVAQIRAYIDDTFGRYGTSNMTGE
jgi:uncharacterized protein with PCYCGC motif